MEKCKWCAGAPVRWCAPATISQLFLIYPILPAYPLGCYK